MTRRLRILQIIAAPASGGAESFVRDLSFALVAQGHFVHIVFLSHATDLGRDALFENDFLAQLFQHGVGYSFLGHDTRRKPWLGLARLRRLVGAMRIDIVHSHLAFGNIFAASVPRVPLVYTHHSENIRFPRAIWAYFRLRAALFIGISQTCAENLQAYLGQGVRVELILNGIDLEGVPACPVGRSRDQLRAICIGRITAQKNYPLLAQAIAALEPAHRKRLAVDIYGEGDSSIVAACFDILGAADVSQEMLRFRGVSSGIRQVLLDYDLFLMSSDSEGLPIALIEATAAGLPAVVTDVGGCREVIDSGPSGIVVPPGDPQAFSRAIAFLLEDAEKRALWSRNARVMAQAFSISQSAKNYARLYKQIIW